MNLATPPFTHGIRPPSTLPVFRKRALTEISRTIDNSKHLWVKRPLGSENTMANYRQALSAEEKAFFDNLHEWTLGGTHNYGDNFSAIGEFSNQLMKSTFKNLYESVIRTLRQHLQTPYVFYRKDGFLPFFRLFNIQDFENQTWNDLIQKIEAPPHFDNVWRSLNWPDGTRFDRTLSFTLPIELPANGHGLIIMNTYRDPLSGRLQKTDLKIEPDRIHLHKLGEDNENESYFLAYTPGEIVLHSGHEFHCIAPFRSFTSSDRRYTLQGWAVWAPGSGWLVFG